MYVYSNLVESVATNMLYVYLVLVESVTTRCMCTLT